MKTSRRTFIFAAASTTIAAVCVGLAGPRTLLKKAKNTFKRLTAPSIEEKAVELAENFPHLQFAEGVCEKFVADHVKKTGNTLFPLKPTVLKRFLLSTDFVQNRGNSDRTIAYVVYYNPRSAPCYNPFRMMV